jgi:hypothetical protein
MCVVLKIPQQMGHYACISKFLLITPEIWIIWGFQLFKRLSPALVQLIRCLSYITTTVLNIPAENSPAKRMHTSIM